MTHMADLQDSTLRLRGVVAPIWREVRPVFDPILGPSDEEGCLEECERAVARVGVGFGVTLFSSKCLVLMGVLRIAVCAFRASKLPKNEAYCTLSRHRRSLCIVGNALASSCPTLDDDSRSPPTC